MTWDWTWPGAAMLVSGMICGVSAAYLWHRPGAVGRTGLVAALVASSVWGLAYSVELAVPTRESKELWGAAKYLGVCALPVAWLAFSLQYAGRERRVTRRLVLALSLVPTATLVMLAIPATRDLVRFYPPGPLERFPIVGLGPVFWVFLVYSVVVVVVATGVLAVTLVRVSRAYRADARVLVAAIALVWTANLLTNLNVGVFGRVDPTPVALAGAGVLLIGAVFRFGLLELVPVARTQLIETMADVVVVLDPYDRVVDLNPAAARVIGCRASEAIGRRVETLLGDEVLAPPGREGSAVRELQLGEGAAARIYEVALSALGDRADAPAGRLLVLRDITDRKQVELRLEQMAHFDVVTGAPNRQLFGDRLERALARSARSGEPLALLFVDLDRFKVINDSLGHDVGDRLLCEVARRIGAVLRAEDTLARFGGDEFCVILPELAHSEDAGVVAAKILGAVSAPLVLDGRSLEISASIGIAVSPQDGADARSLLTQADAAMYVAKRSRGNTAVFSSRELAAESATRLELEEELRGALVRCELRLEFQPLVDLRSGAVHGAEALLRWDHPRRGTLHPADFLPLAEEIGLSAAIDRWVLTEACRHGRRWAVESGTPRSIAVNLSGALCHDDDLPAVVEQALQASCFSAAGLLIELNERTVFSDDDPLTLARLNAVKSIGVLIALDDFGAGRTSLAQLRELPIDQLKIDRSLVARLQGDEGDAVIVSAIVQLAHALSLSVVAEGIERTEQLASLRDLGCDLGQGYLLAKPRRFEHLPVDVLDPT
jgi:diguanylate cyclase (GGDEF)-like protein